MITPESGCDRECAWMVRPRAACRVIPSRTCWRRTTSVPRPAAPRDRATRGYGHDVGWDERFRSGRGREHYEPDVRHSQYGQPGSDRAGHHHRRRGRGDVFGDGLADCASPAHGLHDLYRTLCAGRGGRAGATLHLASNDVTANPFDIVLIDFGTIPSRPISLSRQPADACRRAGAGRGRGWCRTTASLTFTLEHRHGEFPRLSVTLDGADADVFSVTTVRCRHSPRAPRR
jgi:hypothetical protein